jgi:DNA-binding winged helix-turn-helix (wHTH) protein/tetratricopeptide (TPR) repeat protein
VNGEFRIGPWLVQPSLDIITREGTAVHLEPKVMEVLVCLPERAGEVVPRTDLLKAIWPTTFVTDDALKRCVLALRRAFDDDANKPNVIETIPKRGYRMIAAVAPVSTDPAPLARVLPAVARFLPATLHSVGREKERAELTAAFDSVCKGHGTLACVTGEPGIGKTTLVHDFLYDLQASNKEFSLAIGRCSQRLAGEEAYLPFLDALEDLVRSDRATKRTLRETAPSWYAQLFPLERGEASDSALQAYARATTQEGVKRELAGFLGQVTVRMPLILFFDDVHWTDVSTIDLLSHLATKFNSARILVIATYRPSELLLLKHPLISVMRELQARGSCRQIQVELLSPGDVERYIGLQFLGHSFPREFARLIHTRTEGNPLFMVDLLRYLRDQKVIIKTEDDDNWLLVRSLPNLTRVIPQSVASVIEGKVHQLSQRDREVLAAAALYGYEFDSATVAHALEGDTAEVEEALDRLERVHQFVKRVGEDDFSESAVTVRYSFVHVLYQNALYSSLIPTRRVALAGRLAHALEALYRQRSSTIASQLAFLYETARDSVRASDYFLAAAQNAQRIFANEEAIAMSRRGLALLANVPDTPKRALKELGLQVTLAFSLMSTRGYAAPETGASMARACDLCQASSDKRFLCPILWGVWAYYIAKGDMKCARETAEQLSSIAHNVGDPALLLGAHSALGFTLQHQGELIASRSEFDQVRKHHDFAQHSVYVQLYRLDPGLHSQSEMVRLLWLLGYPGQARRTIEETLARSAVLCSPLSLAFFQMFAAFVYQGLREPEKAREVGKACIVLCDEQAIQAERAWVMCPYGWAVAELGFVEEGIAHIRTGLNTQLSIGVEIARPQSLAILGEALWHAGRTEEALQSVEEGLEVSNRNGELYYDAELWRLKGELLKMQDKSAEAECYFQKAIEIARQQAAKSLELRASTSLARLWLKQGERKEAHRLLGNIYAWFTEGFDTADLKEARSLLEELS